MHSLCLPMTHGTPLREPHPRRRHPSLALLGTHGSPSSFPPDMLEEDLHALSCQRRALEIPVASYALRCEGNKAAYIGGGDAARWEGHQGRLPVPMVLGHAGIPQVFLEADEVQQRLDRLVGPIPTLAAGTRRASDAYPLHNGEHGDLVHDVEAQEHGVPLDVREPLHHIQVRHARGVLQLDAGGLGVVGALVDRARLGYRPADVSLVIVFRGHGARQGCILQKQRRLAAALAADEEEVEHDAQGRHGRRRRAHALALATQQPAQQARHGPPLASAAAVVVVVVVTAPPAAERRRRTPEGGGQLPSQGGRGGAQEAQRRGRAALRGRLLEGIRLAGGLHFEVRETCQASGDFVSVRGRVQSPEQSECAKEGQMEEGTDGCLQDEERSARDTPRRERDPRGRDGWGWICATS
ncbi:hypothetical protein S40285_09928 [Stachybotrys chlorohalonatus IBT 40285]|uniref:Uncharacterized protein n=1 Tax=Stachybotrys chlorohalonatus (strain IBT 40285) TaxID=1283841 RepID=A0A084R2E4_STAC4|nr:hypothetical protein S40285_09928 [Stachybotrys chlorohalonata IBT 40285]